MSKRTASEVREMLLAERDTVAKSLEKLDLRGVREAQIRLSVIDQVLASFDRPREDETMIGEPAGTSTY